MAGGTKPPGLAGKDQEVFRPAGRTADPSKPAARVAAAEVALHDFFDDGSEEAVLSFEAALILGQESLEIDRRGQTRPGPESWATRRP